MCSARSYGMTVVDRARSMPLWVRPVIQGSLNPASGQGPRFSSLKKTRSRGATAKVSHLAVNQDRQNDINNPSGI